MRRCGSCSRVDRRTGCIGAGDPDRQASRSGPRSRPTEVRANAGPWPATGFRSRACSCRCCATARRSARSPCTRREAGRVQRPPDRSAQDLRRPGGDRDRERAPVQRDQGGARAADGDRGDPQGHQRARLPTCSRCSTRSSRARAAARWPFGRMSARVGDDWYLAAYDVMGDVGDAALEGCFRRRSRSRPRCQLAHARRVQARCQRHAESDPTIFARWREVRAARISQRLIVPMLREGQAIGVIFVYRAVSRGLSPTSRSTAEDLRRPGGDRDRERAPVQRDQGGARAADGDGGDSQGHRELAHRCPAGVRRDRRAARSGCSGADTRRVALSTASSSTLAGMLRSTSRRGADAARV